MTEAPVVEWMRTGSLAVRIGRAWLAVFVSVLVANLILAISLGTPTAETAGVFVVSSGVITMLVIGVGFGPVDSLKKTAILAVASLVYYAVAVLPATGVAGVIVGLTKRVLA